MNIRDSVVAQRVEGLSAIDAALRLVGVRYWTASTLPALVGTTLPLWLQPPGFVFRWIGALEFLLATILVHSGFSLLHARFEHRMNRRGRSGALLAGAVACLVLAGTLGLHLMRFVPDVIFIVYGLAVLFAGLLYVSPPVRFSQHPGGEIVLSMSLGFLPILGAYLVQTGDLTRTVYLAALPIYAATLLWVWTQQMAFLQRDKEGRRATLVMVFGRRLSGRVGVPGISALLLISVLVAVLSSSVMSLAMVAVVLVLPMWSVVRVSWCSYDDASEMLRARNRAFVVHAGLCIALMVSSVLAAAN